jgi:hypothetical protein
MYSRLIFANQARDGQLIDFRHDHSAKVVRRLREFLFVLISCIFLATTLFAISSTEAAAATTLTTCTDLTTQKTVILKANQKSCKPLHATANWHIVPSDSSAHSGAGYASLRTCTSKRPQFDYQLLKRKCAKYQNTNDYWRTVTSLETPIIASANARGYDSAAFALAATTQNIDAPIAYYLITNIKSGQINKVSPNNLGELSISNLSPLSSYTFTITAVSVDGTSLSSSITPVITTGAVPVVAPAPAPLAAPIIYTVGDTGPGGGTIFYVANTPFACGPTRATTCTYLEAAPSNWNTGGDLIRTWAQSTPVDYQSTAVNNASSPESTTAIGWGYRNTRAIILQGNVETTTSAAALADFHTVTVSGVVYDDWFLPSKDELNQMCKWLVGITGVSLATSTTVCPGGTLNSGPGATGFSADYYWSSSEDNANTAWFQFFLNGNGYGFTKDGNLRVRPVRAF